MTKLEILKPWLEEVEAMEEQLEAMKLTAGRLSGAFRKRGGSVVQLTAGLLGKRFPPGSIYQRRIRNAWERSSHQRTS